MATGEATSGPRSSASETSDPSALRDVVLDIAGPAIPVEEAEALGGVFAAYEAAFRTYAEKHWLADGANWEAANYYDRARIYYVWWARTGRAEYLERAHAIALDYRAKYLEASEYQASTWWYMPAGLLLHHAVTGDEKSRLALGQVADQFSGPYIRDNDWANLVDPAQSEGREQARVLQALLYAWRAEAPSIGVPRIQPELLPDGQPNPAAGQDWGVSGGNDWAALLRSLCTRLIAMQKSDGSRPSSINQDSDKRDMDKPFMNGLLNDVMIEYFEQFEKDPRIVEYVKQNLDYMWANAWLADQQAFVYLPRQKHFQNGVAVDAVNKEEGPVPAWDIGNVVVNGYAWIYKVTGDAEYKARADQIFSGAVKHSYLDGSKQFNQVYTTSYKYLAYRSSENQ